MVFGQAAGATIGSCHPFRELCIKKGVIRGVKPQGRNARHSAKFGGGLHEPVGRAIAVGFAIGTTPETAGEIDHGAHSTQLACCRKRSPGTGGMTNEHYSSFANEWLTSYVFRSCGDACGRAQTSLDVVRLITRANVFQIWPASLTVAEPLRQGDEIAVIHKP